MASKTRNSASQTLRATTHRLSSTPSKGLPRIVSHLAYNLKGCRDLLAATPAQLAAEDQVLVHKLRTQISSLLQDKSLEARWSAVVLIKALLENGGWETLHNSGAWIRGLLDILVKPDPTATKKLCLITITRAFLLTEGLQTLTRELTTPSLPTFITSCLNLVNKKGSPQNARHPQIGHPLLETVLQVFKQLIPRHTSLFRPYVGQIKQLLAPMLAPTPSTLSHDDKGGIPSSMLVTLAHTLYAILPQCAAKNAANTEWSKAVFDVIRHIHGTADLVFRAITEDWNRPSFLGLDAPMRENSGDELSGKIHDSLLLPAWHGFEAGSERLLGLIELLQALLSTSGASITIPLGTIMTVVERVLFVYGPSAHARQHSDLHSRVNSEISRDEREKLWLALPTLHATTIDLLTILVRRIGSCAFSFFNDVLDQVSWTFERECDDAKMKLSTYQLANELLQLAGPSLSRGSGGTLTSLIKACCNDISPSEVRVTRTSKAIGSGSQKASTNGSIHNSDSFLKSEETKIDQPSAQLLLSELAADFLETVLLNVPVEVLKPSDRDRIDQVSILTRNKALMLASILYPTNGRDKVSIIPFLARSDSKAPEVEALLRPRFPLLQRRHVPKEDQSDDDSDAIEDIETEPRGVGRGTFSLPAFPTGDFLSTNNLDMPEVNVRNDSQGAAVFLKTQQPQEAALKRPISSLDVEPLEGMKHTENIFASKRPKFDSLATTEELLNVGATSAMEVTKPVASSKVATINGSSRAQTGNSAAFLANDNASDSNSDIPSIVVGSDFGDTDDEGSAVNEETNDEHMVQASS